MEERQKYYVTLNPIELGIEHVRDDSQLIQYEIEVTKQELEVVSNFIRKYSDELYDVSDILLRPFHFQDVEEDNYESLTNLEQLYQLVYKYGSEKTKRDLESIQRENNH
ncbi:hypothetical protein H1D32_17425 [Anaerobacillus sp. CMMVII]|uniref:hypothetical protein n=1 Tax=Anaerobacillus sp. CMMVII TaxID=2755588 RepID=UPI0021B7B80F|nr:hypothetical protein [Anaerobacillus sp. CMMVII]MCT8139331.1 hypothetical protein [Anaerobacillus sp. CMMVII]